MTARRRPEKKRKPLSGHARPVGRETLQMELQPGDRFTAEEGEWEIVTHPWTTRGGKLVHATGKHPYGTLGHRRYR
jgi:hypothetical protein